MLIRNHRQIKKGKSYRLDGYSFRPDLRGQIFICVAVHGGVAEFKNQDGVLQVAYSSWYGKGARDSGDCIINSVD